MKSLAEHKLSMVTSTVFAMCLAFSAYGSANVFDDAVFWFRGGKDKDGDGYIQQGEFFDDLHANDASLSNHQMPMSSSYYTGDSAAFKGNAVFQNETVVFPALGMSKEMQVLHISCPQKGGKYYFPYDVKPYSIFANNSISNEYTVVSRIKIDDDGINREECLFRIGYDTSDRKGLYLALGRIAAPGGGVDKYIKGYFTPDSASSSSSHAFSIRIPTNTWVDVAAVVGNGKLRIGIAAPESSPNHDNNPTIAFAQTPMWTDNCTLLDDGKYRLFCLEGQTTYKIANEMDQTAFIGSVQQLAIWGRALSDQEVMAAFGMPRPAIFRTGFDNGSSNEFGGTRSGSTQTIDGLGSWQNIANAMQAGDIWTVNFNALRDEANLPQIFSIKSLSGSAAAQIEAKLNGTSLGEGRIAANTRVFWPVAANLVRAGANTLVIERKNGGGHDFLMDAMELGGSLGVGKMTASSSDDGRVDPNLIKTGVPSAADPNPQHWPTKLESSTDETKHLRFRVWVDPDVADKASFTFKTAVSNDTSSGVAFAVYINNQRKTNVNAANEWKQYSLNPGELNGGWNDFDFRTPSSTCCSEFGYYRFETVLPSPFGFTPPPGMSIILR